MAARISYISCRSKFFHNLGENYNLNEWWLIWDYCVSKENYIQPYGRSLPPSRWCELASARLGIWAWSIRLCTGPPNSYSSLFLFRFIKSRPSRAMFRNTPFFDLSWTNLRRCFLISGTPSPVSNSIIWITKIEEKQCKNQKLCFLFVLCLVAVHDQINVAVSILYPVLTRRRSFWLLCVICFSDLHRCGLSGGVQYSKPYTVQFS